MIQESVLSRIEALGGQVSKTTNSSLQEALEAITLKTSLYPKPIDTPWASAEKTEPIRGLSAYFESHKELLQNNKAEFYQQLILEYFRPAGQKPHGQTFFYVRLFTPFQEGTDDFEEWGDIIDEQEVRKEVVGEELVFIQVAWSYGFPDAYFVCLSDKHPENPIVYGTDHEEFFSCITRHGTLEDFLHSFFTQDELITVIEKALNSKE